MFYSESSSIDIMKPLLGILLLALMSSALKAQEPTMLSLYGYGGNGIEQYLRHVTTTDDGGFIVTLSTNSTGTYGNVDSFCGGDDSRSIFQKFSADGSVLEWSKCYGYLGDSAFVFAFPKPGDEMVLGGTYNSNVGWGYIITKQDAAGNTIWQREYSKGNSPLLRDMINTSDGGYLMVGDALYLDTNVLSTYGSCDLWALKLDSLGNKVWSKTFGGSGWDEAENVLEGSNGELYLFGTTQSSDFDCITTNGGMNAFLAKVDSAGNTIWTRCYGGSYGERGFDICFDLHENLLMVCASGSSDSDVTNHINPDSTNVWLLKVDSSGNKLWDSTYGGGGNEYPRAVCQATDGSIWIGGYCRWVGGQIDTNYGGQDGWLLHVDSAGTYINSRVIGSSLQDDILMLHKLSTSDVMTGGYYRDGDGTFSTITNFNGHDAFLSIYGPHSTKVTRLSYTHKDIGIYPNPATDHFNLQLPKDGEKYKVVVKNITGQELMNENISGTKGIIQINVRSFPRGLYCVQVTDGQGNVGLGKLVIN